MLSACATVQQKFHCGSEHWDSAKDDLGNFRTICLSERDVSFHVHFANKNNNSRFTRCSQQGTRSGSKEILKLKLRKGACENGRSLNAVEYQCERLVNEMKCSAPKFDKTIEFKRRDA